MTDSPSTKQNNENQTKDELQKSLDKVLSYSNHSDDGIGKDFKNLYKEEKSRRNEDKLNFQEQRKQLEARIQKFKAELTSREASYRQEREEICRMYLQESNLCMHLKEERASRNLFIKEILNVLRQRNKELKKLSKQKSNRAVAST